MNRDYTRHDSWPSPSGVDPAVERYQHEMCTRRTETGQFAGKSAKICACYKPQGWCARVEIEANHLRRSGQLGQGFSPAPRTEVHHDYDTFSARNGVLA
jgi:hypothetical protein